MDTQEHEYELGTLEEDILVRDESQARTGGSRGDERRWMILGGAGTLALLTAIVAAVSLGGNSEPHKLSASLRGPARDLSAVLAHLQSNAAVSPTAEHVPTEAAPKPRLARQSAKPAQVQAQVQAQRPAPTSPVPAPAAPNPMQDSPTERVPPAPVTHAAAADPADSSVAAFADLPAVSAAEDDTTADVPTNDIADPADVVPTNFEQDDNPFAEDPAEPDEQTDDVPDAAADPPDDVASPTEAPAPEEAPVPEEAPAPVDDVATNGDLAPPTPASVQ